MTDTAGYQVYFTLEGRGGLLVRAEPPTSVVTIITQPASQLPHGQTTLLQETHDDPVGCAALLNGDDPEMVGRQYLDIYRHTYGDETNMTILPPGATRQFTLGGQDNHHPVLLTVCAAPPDGVEVLAYAYLPNGQCVPSPSVQDRFTDPEGYAALMSGIGVDEVAQRYALQYEGRFGKITDPNDMAQSDHVSGEPAMSEVSAFSRWAWVIPILVVLALIIGLLLTRMGGIGPSRHPPIVTPGQQGTPSPRITPEGSMGHPGEHMDGD
jgi:hypothetical protein